MKKQPSAPSPPTKATGLKAQLAHVRSLIVEFKGYCVKYPKSTSYRESVTRLKAQEAEIVDQIGRPHSASA